VRSRAATPRARIKLQWLSQVLRPGNDRFVAICYPEFDVWPESVVDYEWLDLSAADLRWLRKIKVRI
jgi:hypothetical protein